MMYLAGGGYNITEAYNYMPYVLELPQGNYTGPQMAAAIQELLNSFNLTFNFEVIYHTARGSITTSLAWLNKPSITTCFG